MTRERPSAAAVFDVGKSSVRLCAVDDTGDAMATLVRANAVVPGPPYPHFDADNLYSWLVRGFSTLAHDFDIHSIVPVTHGACAALIGEIGLALPIMDYEFDGISAVDAEYDSIARDFASTGSPKLPGGLNLARQLYWQMKNFPRDFARATILPYPQYWTWRLNGSRTWEATSLGCHTDLWAPHRNTFSPFSTAMRWDAQFPRRVNAWTSLGPPTDEVVAATGLSTSCAVLAGIHDSNASYFAHRATRVEPFAVVSTGTWIVVMSNAESLPTLLEGDDTLINVDAIGKPVPTARFMGGREYGAICGDEGTRASPSITDLHDALMIGALAIPSFSTQGGPFRASTGSILGPVPENEIGRAALASLYCALMTDYCLDLLDARGDVIVEGRFASNDAFTSALATLRAPQPVMRSHDETGTLRGALALSAMARGQRPQPARLSRCPTEGAVDMEAVRRRWRSLLPTR